MTHCVRGAFGRLGAAAFATVLASALFAGSLAAQGSTGKIQGTVTDQAGVPIANAQVFIVGTSYGALTSDKGFYFINNVPAGEITLRSQFIGYAPKEVTNVRVLAGQTSTIDVKMTASAVQVKGVEIVAAVNPIVPRDQVSTQTHITSESFNRLPVEDSRAVIALQPGVVESNSGKGLSIRGGRPGEAAVYIDGVLVRNVQRGETDLNLPTNSIEEASVTTGAVGAEFSQAQSGAISFVTKAGGQKYSGALAYQTDDIGTLWRNVGFNRLEASVGGPVWGNLTFFVSGALNGQKSNTLSNILVNRDTPIQSDLDNPVYVMSGVDTVVREPVSFGNPLSDTVNISIPRFVQYSGYCNDTPSGSSSYAQIQGNYGSSCQGLRVPFTANGSMQLQSKLQYTYGSGSRLSLTALSSVGQSRNDPGGAIYNPSEYTGTTATSQGLILNWTQNLSRSADRAMALDLHATYQSDHLISGPLTRQSELDSRSPMGGFLIKPLQYVIDFNTTHDVRINGVTTPGVHYLDDAQVNCLLVGTAYCDNLVPYYQQNSLQESQPYRMNPWGVEQSGLGFLQTQGLEAGPTLEQEHRFGLSGNFDWQLDRFNRLKLGGELQSYDTRRFTSGMISAFGMSAYHEKPTMFGGYVQDRLDLGDVVLEGGLRLDHFDSKALFPFTPGRITTDSLPFNPNDPTANFIKAPAHTAWSPTVRVSFPVTETSNFRLSYAHQVQTPDFNLMFTGKNTDLALTNQNQSFGRDLGFTKTVIFEFGIRHAFSPDMVLDVSAYNKDKVSDIAGRLYQLPDPHANGATSDFRVYTNADFGNVRGLDFKFDRRFSNLFQGTVSYTFQVAKNTGSDPNSYFNTTARQISTLTGTTAPPPQAILTTNDDRPHNLAGALQLSFPADWHTGSMLGKVLGNVGAFATFRFSSGLPYTLLRQAGVGSTVGGFGLEGIAVEPINSSRMPWFKNVDLRVTKGLRLGSLDWTLFAESKNLFNWRNVLNLFTESGDVNNAAFEQKFIAGESQNLLSEAKAAGVLTTDAKGNPAVDLSAPGVCKGWQGTSTATAPSAESGPVDCVLLVRAEQRYGNGDGIFSQNEYVKAFTAWYNFFNAPSGFYGTGRRIRIGAEFTF
jgi:hypothetical protein